MTSSEEHFQENVELWNKHNAQHTDASARSSWEGAEITWGLWHVPDAEIGIFDELAGLDVVDLGCGTAYFSAWLARRGARVVGVDPTPAQLDTARRLQAELGLEFELVEAFAEDVPLPDASFDLAISEYGASIWADPYRWIPEAARLLRPGGRLVFLRNSTLVMLCFPDVGRAQERLMRSQFGMYRFSWPEDGGAVEYHLPHGELLALLRGSGFEIERLVELQAPPDAKTDPVYDDVPAEWGRKWPAEEIWAARKRHVPGSGP